MGYINIQSVRVTDGTTTLDHVLPVGATIFNEDTGQTFTVTGTVTATDTLDGLIATNKILTSDVAPNTMRNTVVSGAGVTDITGAVVTYGDSILSYADGYDSNGNSIDKKETLSAGTYTITKTYTAGEEIAIYKDYGGAINDGVFGANLNSGWGQNFDFNVTNTYMVSGDSTSNESATNADCAVFTNEPVRGGSDQLWEGFTEPTTTNAVRWLANVNNVKVTYQVLGAETALTFTKLALYYQDAASFGTFEIRGSNDPNFFSNPDANPGTLISTETCPTSTFSTFHIFEFTNTTPYTYYGIFVVTPPGGTLYIYSIIWLTEGDITIRKGYNLETGESYGPLVLATGISEGGSDAGNLSPNSYQYESKTTSFNENSLATQKFVDDENTGLVNLKEGGVDNWQLKDNNEQYHVALGEDAIDMSFSDGSQLTGASGKESFAIGQRCIASGQRSFTGGGLFCESSGFGSFTFGSSAKATDNYSFAIGERSSSEARASFCGGIYTSPSAVTGRSGFSFQETTVTKAVAADNSAVLGGTDNAIDATAPRSVVLGGDTQSATQPDMVYLSGTKYKSYTTAEIAALPDSELGTFVFDSDLGSLVQCTDATPAANVWTVTAPSGLESITEGGKTGRALIGTDRSLSADIGSNALDLNIAVAKVGAGASGTNSIAGGAGTASGNGSVAFGNGISSGSNSFMNGTGTASGDNSVSFTNRGEASGAGSYIGGLTGAGFTGSGNASGVTAFVHQWVDGNGSSRDAAADYSAILGGQDNSTTAAATRSVILGGDTQSATQPDMVYVPGIKLQDFTTANAPASPENGTIYHDTTLNKLRVYLNGAWETIQSV